VLLRIALLIVIVLFSALGYMTYLNHEIPVTLFLIQGRPLTTSIPAVIIVSFASGALIVFVVGLMRDLVEGWKQLRRDRKEKKDESVQGEIAKGLTFLAQGNTDRAQTHLTNALRRDPENFDLCVRLSDLFAAQGKLNEAIDMLDRAWALDSQNWEILFKKAKLYDQMGNRSLVIGTLKKLMAMDPGNLRALVELRDIYLREEDWVKARALQRNLMREKRNGPDIAQEKDRYLGITYECARSLPAKDKDGALEKSIRLCKEIIKQDRGFLPAYLLIGEIYQKQKRWVEAGRILGRGFRVSKHVIFLLRLEDLYLKRNDRRTLLKIHRRIIESNSGNTIFPFFYARLCLRLNMLDEAMDELVEIKDRRKHMASLHSLMAEIFARKGRPEEAVRAYKTATELAGYEKPLFVCRFCRRETTEWVARCPLCSQWNGYHLAIQEDEPDPPVKA
jgi:lipopolysaccharide biosynthesis regulator YciM